MQSGSLLRTKFHFFLVLAAFDAHLHSVTVAKLMEGKKPLVVLKHNLPLGRALEMLAEHDILGAPVVNDQGTFLGFVDVLDIAGFTLHEMHVEGHRLHDPAFADDHFFNQPISQVVNFSKCDDSIIVSPTTSLHTVVELFNRVRVHRLAVSSANQIVGILTQSDLVAYFAEILSAKSFSIPRMESSLAELSLVRPVVSVFLDASVTDALECLYKNKVSGLALLDLQGRVSGNFSASDLRNFTKTSFRDFADKTVLRYLVKRSNAVSAPRTICEEASLAEVVNILSKERIHRIYVTRPGSEAVRGVVSLSDIIRLAHPKHKK